MIRKDHGLVEVRCQFDTLPTLAMFIEAAAQSSAAFNVDEEPKIGFLAIAKNVKLLDKVKEKVYTFRLKEEVEINQYKQFSFEAFRQNDNKKVVSGSFTLVIDG